MKIAVLGTGMVGNALATKLVQLGHEIMMGSRTANSEPAQAWLQSVNGAAKIGTFAASAAFGDVVIDCTSGANSLAALRQAGSGNLRDKILIQVGNPLDFSKGMPPSLTVCNTDSQGEQTQRQFPDARVVKALNTVNCEIMIAPERLPGDHNLFICGNDTTAKATVTKYLSDWFGWKPGNIIDLGDISNARGTEMFLALWIRLYAKFSSPHFNIHVVRGN